MDRRDFVRTVATGLVTLGFPLRVAEALAEEAKPEETREDEGVSEGLVIKVNYNPTGRARKSWKKGIGVVASGTFYPSSIDVTQNVTPVWSEYQVEPYLYQDRGEVTLKIPLS